MNKNINNSHNDLDFNDDFIKSLKRKFSNKYNKEVSNKDLDFARKNSDEVTIDDLLIWLINNEDIVNKHHRKITNIKISLLFILLFSMFFYSISLNF